MKEAAKMATRNENAGDVDMKKTSDGEDEGTSTLLPSSLHYFILLNSTRGRPGPFRDADIVDHNFETVGTAAVSGQPLTALDRLFSHGHRGTGCEGRVGGWGDDVIHIF
jgi:hypothetical protein